MVENVSLPPSVTAHPQVGVSAPKTTEQRAEIKSERAVDVKDAPEALDQRNPEQTRFEAVKQAAQTISANPYPVSDVRFTIYQERSQQGGIIYVTRFTSLETGEVELVREPELMLKSGSSNMGSLLTASV